MAAGLCAAAVGTETDGSIAAPASACGIVGLKPGVGVVSQQGIVPISRSQDAAGPMTRSVADAALLLAALAEHPADYATVCRPDALAGMRIGVLRAPFTGGLPSVERIFDDALRALGEAGATLVEPVEVPALEEMWESDCEQVVMLHEFHAGLDAYLSDRQGVPIRTLEDLIAFNREHADEEMPYFGQERLELAVETGPLDDPAYLAAAHLNRELSRGRGIDAALAEHRLDALVTPSGLPPTVVDLAVSGLDRAYRSSTRPAAMAGYPIISVPAGFAHGELPVGISCLAGAGSEALLLGLAFAFERATGHHRPPRFLPRLEFQ